MKKAPLVTRATDHPKPIPSAQEPKQPSDSLNLSPERIAEGVSSNTELLNSILHRGDQAHQLRHWGINE